LYYIEKLMKQGLVELKMGDIMGTDVISVYIKDTVKEAAAKLKDSPAYVEGAPVLDDDSQVVGIILKTDLDENSTKTVSDILLADAPTSSPDDEITEAACAMLKSKDYVIPVVDENKMLLGLVTRTDVFQTLEYQRTQKAQKVN